MAYIQSRCTRRLPALLLRLRVALRSREPVSARALGRPCRPWADDGGDKGSGWKASYW